MRELHAATALASPLDEIDAARAEAALAEALTTGGDHADLYAEYRIGSELALEDQRIRSLGEGVTLGVGVRVVKGEATGYAYTESFDRLLAAARTAGQVARGGGATRPVALRPDTAPPGDPPPRSSLEVHPAEKVALLRRADAAARAADSGVIGFAASLSEELREVLIATADGRLVRDLQPQIRFSCRVVVERGDRRQIGTSGGGGRLDLDYFLAAGRTPEDHGREAVRTAVAMLDAREAPAGEMPVVLSPADSGILLHEAIGHGLEADFIRKRTSSYTDRLGEEVASPLCTIVDDATIRQARGSIRVDDEGHPGRRTTLIESGVLCGYLHDRQSALLFAAAGSGNGRRQSFRHVPLPRMTNTCLLPGPHGPDEIVRSVHRGVLARRLASGQVDIATGDFVFSVTEAYLIEDGQVTAPLKGVNLIGNGPEVLRRVTMVGSDHALSDGNWTCGKDGQSVPVGMGTPSVKVDRMTIRGDRNVNDSNEELRQLSARTVELARRAGADDAEAMCRDSTELVVKVRLGELELVKEAGLRALGLRVFVGGRAAQTFTSDLRPDAIARLAARTVALAELAEPDPLNLLPETEASVAVNPDLELWDDRVASVGAAWAIDLARRAEGAALGGDPRVTSSNGARVTRAVAAVAFANSGGFVGSYTGTYATLSVSPLCEDAGGKRRAGQGWTAGRYLGDFQDPEVVGLEATRSAVTRLGARKVATAVVPVVFHPDAGRSLVRGIFSVSNGAAFHRKASYLVGREGQACASPLVTIVDDPLRPRGPGSRPFDGDGLRSRRNVVIEAGTLRTVLCDTYSARRLGRPSTASAGRGVGGSPAPAITNLVMQAGATPAAELTSTVARGFYVNELIGAGLNTATGDFSRGAAGFWIQDGELAFPVSEVTISANFDRMWRAVDAVGDDAVVRTSIICPTFRVAEVTVAGT